MHDPLALFMAQVVVIVVVARVIALATNRLGQPPVIAEMVGGIVLGPSLLGHVLPTLSATLFAPDSLGALRITSQLGLVIFMFLVGVELDASHFRKRSWSSIVISHSGIITPFVLGVALALWMYPRYCSATTSRVAFTLFVGVAMSVTAFPVLARILLERGLSTTRLGRHARQVSHRAAERGAFIGILLVVLPPRRAHRFLCLRLARAHRLGETPPCCVVKVIGLAEHHVPHRAGHVAA